MASVLAGDLLRDESVASTVATSGRIDAVRALIDADARADQRKPYSDADFDRSLTEAVQATGDTVGPPVIGIRAFVDQRTPIVAAELP